MMKVRRRDLLFKIDNGVTLCTLQILCLFEAVSSSLVSYTTAEELVLLRSLILYHWKVIKENYSLTFYIIVSSFYVLNNSLKIFIYVMI